MDFNCCMGPTCTKAVESLGLEKMLRCTRCRNAIYCSVDCQKKDWPEHKNSCTTTKPWFHKFRKCQDGTSHFGKLELMTWKGEDEHVGTLGWGGVVEDESENHRKKFETEFASSEEKFYKYWPQGFRWTCCGLDGQQTFGCDHHGTGPTPCKCDYCSMGKPVPAALYTGEAQSRKGLTLPRGPDPRSYNPATAAINEMGRSMLGIDDVAVQMKLRLGLNERSS